MRKLVFRKLIQLPVAGGLAICGALASPALPAAQSIAVQESEGQVRRALERLPYYGVFDFLAFSLDRGTVTLTGYTHRAALKADAQDAARRAPGVDEVANEIEILPVSPNDDRIRWATFYTIYNDDFLSRYAPAGQHGVRDALLEARRFPGVQPFGTYPIHIIVRNGRTRLLGVVDNDADKQVAGMRARQVGGVFGVDNELVVINK